MLAGYLTLSLRTDYNTCLNVPKYLQWIERDLLPSSGNQKHPSSVVCVGLRFVDAVAFLKSWLYQVPFKRGFLAKSLNYVFLTQKTHCLCLWEHFPSFSFPVTLNNTFRNFHLVWTVSTIKAALYLTRLTYELISADKMYCACWCHY